MWNSWWTSVSHADLDGFALNLGAGFLRAASLSPDRGWLLAQTGQPKTLETLARELRFSEQVIEKALEDLVAIGTMVRRDSDGAYGFPNFLARQESPDADRKRRDRAGLKPAAETTDHGPAGDQISPDKDPECPPQEDQRIRDLNSSKRNKDSEGTPESISDVSQKPEQPTLFALAPMEPELPAGETLARLWDDRIKPPMLPVGRMSTKRQEASRRLLEVLREHQPPQEALLATMTRYIDALTSSPLCRGEVRPAEEGAKPWVASFGWAIGAEGKGSRNRAALEEQVRKALEGEYAPRPARAANDAPPGPRRPIFRAGQGEV